MGDNIIDIIVRWILPISPVRDDTHEHVTVAGSSSA